MALRRRILWVALLALGCKTLEGGDVAEPDYSAEAETDLARGNEALESRNYLEAQKYFEHVRSKYPYLAAATEAELRLADTDFERERYLEARDAYHTFVKLHPTHPKADYAAFRAALTHHKEIPSDFFLLPPSREKDQVEVRATVRAMSDFLRQYPGSPYAGEARALLEDSRRRLAAHEMYVAEFYAKRERWGAVANRLEGVVENFPGLGFDEGALFELYRAYLKLNQPEKAQAALRKVIERFPSSNAAEKAQKLLGS